MWGFVICQDANSPRFESTQIRWLSPSPSSFLPRTQTELVLSTRFIWRLTDETNFGPFFGSQHHHNRADSLSIHAVRIEWQFAWSDIREIVPFFAFVQCISVCALSNTHAYTLFSTIFPFAWRNMMSARPSEFIIVHRPTAKGFVVTMPRAPDLIYPSQMTSLFPFLLPAC